MLSLLLLAALQADSSPVRFEPGMQWTYQGHYRATSQGRLDVVRDFPVQARYLALPESEAGERFVLLWLDFGAGLSRFRGEESHPEPVQWGTFLQLREDLRVRTSLAPRRYEHVAASDMELVPFPPPGTPFRPGVALSIAKTNKSGYYNFRGDWNVRSTRDAGRVRTEISPVELPLPELDLGEARQLTAYREAYEIDPESGVLVAFERSDRQTEKLPDQPESRWEFDVELRLVEQERVALEETREYLDQLLAVRDLLFAYDPESDVPGRAEVDALLADLEGSPVQAIARDLLLPALTLGMRVQEGPIWYADDAESLLGKPAPPFAAEDLDSNRIALEEHRGEPLLLVFWASW